MVENIEKFIGETAKSLREDTFVKMTLGNYRGADEHLQKLLIRLVKTRKGLRLFFLYRYQTRDTVKNHSVDEALHILSELLGRDFFRGHLFTTVNDFQLDAGKKRARMHIGRPAFTAKPPRNHNREKKIQIDPNTFYLKALGITTDHGEIRDKQQGKWRQINKFVEILGGLFDKSPLKDKNELNIVDMGSGKGYLTFATYDYFKNVLDGRNVTVMEGVPKGLKLSVTGVDTRPQLVELCNEIAKAGELESLCFVQGSISDFELKDVDILIALHACDTATDDALFKGITANAEIIIAAPCCHKEIRPQIKPPAMFKDILKHGTMLERTAETITDGLRSLLLERCGYATKLFEFVATEHTPKNNMIVATRMEKSGNTEKIEEQIRAVKAFYGIGEQELERLLGEF